VQFVLTLSACEAGYDALGSELVTALCTSGVVGGGVSSKADGNYSIGGSGAAALILAAASSGRSDAALFDVLLTLCSAQEMELTLSNLGDARIASILVDKDVLESLDVRASGFLNTLCSDAILDDPRGIAPPPSSPGGYPDFLTEFELEVSKTLTIAEMTHSQGSLVAGVFVPLVSHTKKIAVFPENAACFATYVNVPAKRTNLQRWRLRVVEAAGWNIVVVSEKEWRGFTDTQDRADYLRKLIQQPIAASEL